MQDSEDLYELLQVHPRADPEVVQAAYRCLVFKYHPDRNPSPRATYQMQGLNHAYEVLSDPIRRAKYNSVRNASDARVVRASSQGNCDSEGDGETCGAGTSATESPATEPLPVNPQPTAGNATSPAPGEEASSEIDFTISYPGQGPRFGFRLPSWVIILIALGAIGGLITDLVL